MYYKRWTGRTLCLLMSLVFYLNAAAQQGSFAEKFSEGVKLDEENELSLSFQIWTSLAKEYSENGNLNYRAGLAHLRIGRQKKAALPYLQQAVEIGISKNYDRFSPLEKQSPVESLYYLGKAYHLNYKLDQAMESYNDFLKRAPAKHYLAPMAMLGIRQAENAKDLIANPVDYKIENLGQVINTEYPEFSPVISVDENALFFTSSRLRPDSSNLMVRDRKTGDYFNDIYVSYRDRQGAWQEPELLEINRTDHTATVNVAADGQTLFIYRDDAGVGNIYESKLVGETWTEPIKLEGGINSSSWETHIAKSVDGQTAYVVSNRPGGLGGRDIYRVRKLPDGKWSKAQNLGPNVNTRYEEDAVFISPDGRTLYFSSEGHNSMGGFDIFYSTYNEDDDSWGEPVNIGYPINTVDDDVFFVTSADERRAYYSSVRDSGYGEKDIYQVFLPGERDIRLALLLGNIQVAEGGRFPENLLVNVTNKQTQAVETYTPRRRDGSFVAILPPCYDYEVEYEVGGLVLATDTFSVGCENAYQEIYKELLLNPIRIEADGSASVVRGEDGELIVSSTTGDMQPATFKRFFGYNENIVSLEEEIFSKFMKQLQSIVAQKGQVNVQVTGSASRVPTRTFGSNEKLARLRADNAVTRIQKYAGEMGIAADKIKFEKVSSAVNGPAYQGDYKSGEENYRRYQYVDIKAE